MKSFTKQDIDKLILDGRCVIIADNFVFDPTEYLNKHPGGKYVLETKKGKIVDKHYNMHSNEAHIKWERFKIGIFKSDTTHKLSNQGCCVII